MAAATATRLRAKVDKVIAGINAELEKQDRRMDVDHPMSRPWNTPKILVLPDGAGWADNAIVTLSGENGCPVLDYYEEFRFALVETFEDRLREIGCFREWVNPGVAAIYPID